MIIDEILTILKNDNTLDTLIDGIYHIASDGVCNCLVYNLEPLTSDRVVEQNRLEITAINSDYITNMNVIKRVKELLLTEGDSALTQNILNVTLNGGGCLENIATSTIHTKINFIIKNRGY